MTLIHVYFRLDAYRSSPLPPAFLADVSARFAAARDGGVKLVPRFTYNFPHGSVDPKVDRDAPLPQVLAHLDQLAPVLRDNADVIAFMEAGFVGAWGEWHDSTSGLEEPGAKRAIVTRLLDILPPSRDVVLRYERDKREILGRDRPLTAAEAFTDIPAARIGFHNDCFLAGPDDWGTYRPTRNRPISAAKAYISAETRYVPQGGETCNSAPDAQPFIGCKAALGELADQHWSQLNSDYHLGVLGRWKSEGCYAEISRRLGYRLRLVRSQYPVSVRRGGQLRATITLLNDGFAAPYNGRPVELVLRAKGVPDVRLSLPDDPRRWLPGRPVRLDIQARVPAAVRTGTYDASLALPDPEPRLRGRADYAIRLANRDVWNPATGDNALHWRIQVR